MVFPRAVICFMFWAAFCYLCALVMSMPEGPTIAAVLFTGFLSVRHVRHRWAIRRANQDIDEEYRQLIEDSRKR